MAGPVRPRLHWSVPDPVRSNTDAAFERYEDGKLDDPAGKGVDAVGPIRDDIKQRVQSWSPT